MRHLELRYEDKKKHVVRKASDGTSLGEIYLETGWSEFVFEPQAGTMYSIECLVELTAMVRDLNRAHGVKRF